MKSIISINKKFMSVIPKRLVELINNSKYTKGVELCINVNEQEEMKYLDELVFELKRNDLVLQIHGNVELDFDKQVEYMKVLEGYSDYLGYPIVVTLHTIYDDDPVISLSKTVDYISNLLKSIDNNKITICLENLNDARKVSRLDKNDIKETVLNDEAIYFTYDIGHEIADYGRITDLDEYMINDIRNVHIHSNNNQGVDHLPIYRNDIHWNEIIKGIEFLIVNKYQYNIVYEYGLEYCSGETVEEKIIDYLNSIDIVSEKYSE